MKTGTGIFFWTYNLYAVVRDSSFNIFTFFLIDTAYSVLEVYCNRYHEQCFRKNSNKLRHLLRQVLQAYYHLHIFELLNIEIQQFIFLLLTETLACRNMAGILIHTKIHTDSERVKYVDDVTYFKLWKQRKIRLDFLPFLFF